MIFIYQCRKQDVLGNIQKMVILIDVTTKSFSQTYKLSTEWVSLMVITICQPLQIAHRMGLFGGYKTISPKIAQRIGFCVFKNEWQGIKEISANTMVIFITRKWIDPQPGIFTAKVRENSFFPISQLSFSYFLLFFFFPIIFNLMTFLLLL